ncbi:hypothetical protein [Phycicoccus flavus]|uniref:Uncharacterized protein n=1 Tax=Phycicoccus flavus TaxID=2502783 RepID=A0A8T6R565_9MICO|nr:hypothetical protein [Phycicoccus flavus]NHA69619.1 hypothetical protein [Phycicoccus flavus]
MSLRPAVDRGTRRWWRADVDDEDVLRLDLARLVGPTLAMRPLDRTTPR